jgi:phosphoglycolate phosphatase
MIRKETYLRKIKHVTFDLDGTLVNSFQNIYKATVKSLEELNIKAHLSEQELYKRIGQHFVDIFEELNIPVKDFDGFIEIYKKHYFDFIGESKPYPHVEETLDFLSSHNILISLLTTKGQDQADKIIDHLSFRKYFSFVMGRRKGIANKPSAEPLIYICKELNLSPSDSLIVGDTELDIECGKNAGAKTCAVLYGYRGKSILSKAKPDYMISDIKEIEQIVIT